MASRTKTEMAAALSRKLRISVVWPPIQSSLQKIAELPPRQPCLPFWPCSPPPGGCMFTVDEVTAEAIRRAYDEGGELAGVVEFRRHFPLITDNAKAGE